MLLTVYFCKVTIGLQRYLQEKVVSCHCDIKLYQTNLAVFCNTSFNTSAFYRNLQKCCAEKSPQAVD